MTDLAKLKRAEDLMSQAGMTVDEWIGRVQRQKGYKYKTTKIYRALKNLEASTKTPLPPKPIPPPPVVPPVKPGTVDVSKGQNVLFLTNDISGALSSNPKYKLAATADWGYRVNYTAEFLRSAMAQGRLRIWCDCRPQPNGTPPSVAKTWAQELGLEWPECFIGQGENADEFDRAVEAGAGVIIGNINPRTPSTPGGLRPDQWAMIDSGQVIWVNETYWNVNRNMAPVTWHNLDGVACNCVACYASSSEGAVYYSLAQQKADGKFNTDVDGVYVAGMQPEDWAVLR
jgi:hypothetical protein